MPRSRGTAGDSRQTAQKVTCEARRRRALRLVASNVVSLEERRQERKIEPDVIRTLEAPLNNARAGKMTGLIYACDMGDPNEEVISGIAGAYRRDRWLGLGVTSQLHYRVGAFFDDER